MFELFFGDVASQENAEKRYFAFLSICSNHSSPGVLAEKIGQPGTNSPV